MSDDAYKIVEHPVRVRGDAVERVFTVYGVTLATLPPGLPALRETFRPGPESTRTYRVYEREAAEECDGVVTFRARYEPVD